MSARNQAGISEAEWDEAWARYDARAPRTPPGPACPPAALPPRPDPCGRAPARPRGRRRQVLAWLAVAASLGWLGTPGIAAWQAARAVERRDPEAIGRHIDLAAVGAEMRAEFARSISLPADSPAAAFLEGMAEDMARAWSRPAAVAEVARLRGVEGGGAVPVLRLGSLGLTSFEVALGSAAAPMTLRLALTEAAPAPRWQVTGVRFEGALPPGGRDLALRVSLR